MKPEYDYFSFTKWRVSMLPYYFQQLTNIVEMRNEKKYLSCEVFSNLFFYYKELRLFKFQDVSIDILRQAETIIRTRYK